ncbi:MAG: toprim domain-containing protein [Acidobacteriota bacterium]|nr:toprim domain-containing protein [Acidobacteriota bacterium]
MNQRLVFQIRSLRSNDAGDLVPVIVGHMGRATSVEQAEQDGKWWTYGGFRKSLELYNVDLAVLNPEARAQAAETGHVLVVEGCFDVAKLYAAGIKNVVALFGSRLSERQAELLATLAEEVGVERLRFFLDRDEAGQQGTASAQELLLRAPEENPGLVVDSFDWGQSWQSPVRGAVQIPASITDPCDFSLGQLQWLRAEGLL